MSVWLQAACQSVAKQFRNMAQLPEREADKAVLSYLSQGRLKFKECFNLGEHTEWALLPWIALQTL